MKRIISTLFFSAVFLFAWSQGTVSGIIWDNETEEPLIGASVLVKGTSQGTVTDLDGNFTINNVESGDQTLVISYTGYSSIEMPVSVSSGTNNLGTINMETDIIGLKEVTVIASLAIDRKTPVAVSSINTEEIELKTGNMEFPEILKSTPSVYATKLGGGFGDARINVRGFDQRNTAVLINGIPVNDMENGWVYWSNWAGLSDVTRTIQVQRGLGASKLAIASVGGTLNLITKTTDMRRGGSAFTTVGNDGYVKYGLTVSSGRTDKGWAFTFSGSRTTGNGYIDATWINAWSYFASIAKELGNNHQLVFTAIGAPQRHGQRTFRERLSTYVDIDDEEDWEEVIKESTVSDFDERTEINGVKVSGRGSIRYNGDWGFKDGEIFSMRENFYHKPQFALNHYWTINQDAFLATSAYWSFGRGGGTGDRGGIGGRGPWGYRDDMGIQRIDDVVRWNTGTAVEGFPAPANINHPGYGFVATERNGIIRRASMNEHNWYGILTNLNLDLNDNLTLLGGLDFRYYEGLHYRRVVDLLGADAWLDTRDVNFQDFALDVNADGDTNDREVGKLVEEDQGGFTIDRDGNKIHYDNDGIVFWTGGFAQLEWDFDNINFFVSGSVSNTGYKRADRFIYEIGSDLEETDVINYVGYNGKAGVNFRLDDKNNVYVNTGYYSRAPDFDVVFPNFNNVDINEDADNEKVIGFEAGYGLRSSKFSGNLNLYYTNWIDKTEDRRFNDDQGNEFFATVTGIDALHMGVELDFIAAVAKGFDVKGMVSIGNWEWKNNVDAQISDDNNVVVDNVKIFADGLKVGDAAQTSFAIEGRYTFDFGLGVDLEYQYYDNLYSDFDPGSRDESAVPTLQLPAYGILNGGITWTTKIQNSDVRFRFNMNNILDELYIAEADEPSNYDPTSNDRNYWLQRAGGFFGFGRTWNVGAKVSF